MTVFQEVNLSKVGSIKGYHKPRGLKHGVRGPTTEMAGETGPSFHPMQLLWKSGLQESWREQEQGPVAPGQGDLLERLKGCDLSWQNSAPFT